MSKIVGEVSTLIKRMYLIFNYYNHFFKKIGYNLIYKILLYNTNIFYMILELIFSFP